MMELQPITPDSLDDEALTDLIDIRKRGVEHHASEGNKVQHAIQSLTLMALVELQERRKTDSAEPAAEIREDLGRLFVKIIHPSTLKAGDKLYTAPPAPEVN